MRAAPTDYFDVPFAALAHRGGACADAPIEVENSLRAFTAAWAMGYRYLETDVHVTADGTLVAFHDDVLDRVTDAGGRLAALPWVEVARARIGGTEAIPTLDELLDALPLARFNIDIKAPAAVEPLARTLAAHGALTRVCVGSFSTRRLARFRRLTRGAVATSASPLEVGVFALAPGVRGVWPLHGRAFQMPTHEPRTGVRLLRPGVIEAAHRRGAAVHVWTVNDRTEMESLIDLGVDGIVTDDIATLKAVLVARDLWEGNQ
ncbi:MAG: glycerophosphodiester phosphodiesterase family protein [Actinomycetes bacterium]